MMRLIRSPWARAFLVWTVAFFAVAIVVALEALVSLGQAEQACFFEPVPCPVAGHPKLVQLDVAVFVIPLIWLVGVILGVVARAVADRRQRGRRPIVESR
jgi:hypothetical protein